MFAMSSLKFFVLKTVFAPDLHSNEHLIDHSAACSGKNTYLPRTTANPFKVK